MAYTFRSLFAIVLMACMGSCSSLSRWSQSFAEAPLVPEFSGGARGAGIAHKKALLTAEYRELAVAEAQLKREQSSLAAMPVGRRGSSGMVATQRGAIAIDSGKVARHRATIARLRRELMDAGVTIITHD